MNDLPQIPELPETWKLVTLEAVAERFQYGTSDKADANERTGFPVLRMGNIQDGKIDLSDLKYVSKAKVSDEFLLQQGDILFNRTNSPELVGKTAVFSQSEPMTFASYLIRVQVNQSLVRSLFVSWWLNSAWGRQWARHVRADGVSQSNINSTKLAAMPLPLPSLAEQDEAIRVGSQLLALADTVEKRLNPAVARVERITQSILAKAFSGQLVPTEAELAQTEGRSFESAEQLLARVKGELEGNPGASKRRGRMRSEPDEGEKAKRRSVR